MHNFCFCCDIALRLRAENHGQHLAFERRRLFHHRLIGDGFQHPVEQAASDFRVRDFTGLELDRDLHFVAVVQKFQRVPNAHLKIMFPP